MLKVTPTVILWICELLQWGEECTVSLSLFAGLERILRRFSIFAEEPCKSTITTSEPCSPLFKEAQPRPSKHSVSLIRVFIQFTCYVKCSFIVNYYNKASNRIVPKQKELVSSSGYSSYTKWVDFPHTHTHINVCELQESSVYLLYTGRYTPSFSYIFNINV